MSNSYSIGEAAAAAGISTETLRIWERRYGRPTPERRASGHRRYSEDQVAWLRRIAKVVSNGLRPSRAVKLSDEALGALCDDRPPAPVIAPEVGRLMAAVGRLDGQEFIRELDQAFARRDVLRFAQEIVGPFTGELDRTVEAGVLDVRHENYATGILEDYLHARRARFVVDEQGPRVVITSLEGGRCRVRMEMSALLCATYGVGHAMFPARPDPARIGEAVRRERADMLAVCIPPGDPAYSPRAIEAIRRALPRGVQLLVGGPGAAQVSDWPAGVGTVPNFETFAAWLRHAQRARLAHVAVGAGPTVGVGSLAAG